MRTDKTGLKVLYTQILIVLGFNDSYISTHVGHFVSSPRVREKRDRRDRVREKRDRRDSRGGERDGQGEKGK